MAYGRIAIGLLLLTAMGYWAHRTYPLPSAEQLASDPERFEGELGFFGTLVEFTDDGIILAKRGQRFRATVQIDPRPPIGTTVSIHGEFHAPDHFTADQWHIHRGRRFKVVISVLPLLLVLPFVLRAIGFDRDRKAFTLRQPPDA